MSLILAIIGIAGFIFAFGLGMEHLAENPPDAGMVDDSEDEK